jgi:hypothetical protein
MNNERELRWYTVWSDEHPGHPPEQIQEHRARDAAKVWFDAYWCCLGRTDEARVFVRRMSDGKLYAFDVCVEDIQLDLDVAVVPLDAEGRPIERAGDAVTAESLERAARATG